MLFNLFFILWIGSKNKRSHEGQMLSMKHISNKAGQTELKKAS